MFAGTATTRRARRCARQTPRAVPREQAQGREREQVQEHEGRFGKWGGKQRQADEQTLQSARNLQASGLQDDIAYCARLSVLSAVPRFTRMLGCAAEVALL